MASSLSVLSETSERLADVGPRALVIVAHPDGYLLAHPDLRWRIVTLCRASDPDRAPKFSRVLERFGAQGEMADLDDGPEQAPLPLRQVQESIAGLLVGAEYDLVLTHGPRGEYTRHRRHEECCRSVVDLWESGAIIAKQMWLFAYEDGGRAYQPRVRDDCDRRDLLPDNIWHEKRRLVTDVYGFAPESWEARAVPKEEGFWCFDSPRAAVERVAAWEQLS